jgi:hypothetical protein
VTLLHLAESRLRRFLRNHAQRLRLAASERRVQTHRGLRPFHSLGKPLTSRLAWPVHSRDIPYDVRPWRDIHALGKPLSDTLSRTSRDNFHVQRCDGRDYQARFESLTSGLARPSHSREARAISGRGEVHTRGESLGSPLRDTPSANSNLRRRDGHRSRLGRWTMPSAAPRAITPVCIYSPGTPSHGAFSATTYAPGPTTHSPHD